MEQLISELIISLCSCVKRQLDQSSKSQGEDAVLTSRSQSGIDSRSDGGALIGTGKLLSH